MQNAQPLILRYTRKNEVELALCCTHLISTVTGEFSFTVQMQESA
jgi:hypothetical protein